MKAPNLIMWLEGEGKKTHTLSTKKRNLENAAEHSISKPMLAITREGVAVGFDCRIVVCSTKEWLLDKSALCHHCPSSVEENLQHCTFLWVTPGLNGGNKY